MDREDVWPSPGQQEYPGSRVEHQMGSGGFGPENGISYETEDTNIGPKFDRIWTRF